MMDIRIRIISCKFNMRKKYAHALFFLILLFLCLNIATPVYAAVTYYIANNGSDVNDGTSEFSPWQSLSRAKSVNLQPGDKLLFQRGSTWTGELTITRSGQANNPITIGAYGSAIAKPTFQNPGGTWNHAIELWGDYILVEDVLVKDTKEAGISIEVGADYNTIRNIEAVSTGQAILVRGTHNLITNNYIHDGIMVVNTQGGDDDFGANGIVIRSANNEVSYNQIINCRAPSYDYGYDGGAFEFYSTSSTPGNMDNNYIHHNFVQGCNGFMEVGGKNPKSMRNNIIAYNISYNNYSFASIHNGTGGGFQVDVQNLRIENNTIVETTGAGKHIFWIWQPASAGTVNFRNNIVYSDTKYGASNQVNFSHSNNVFYFISGASFPSSYANSSDMVDQNPQFVNLSNGDLHLLSHSPAIDKGVHLGYSQDFDGRSIAGVPDIGAFEYSTGGLPPTPTVTPTPDTTLILGDLDRDADVDIRDYNLLVADFGKTGSPGFIAADIIKDGQVDIFDYNILVTNFGR
ncbi:MAG: choice-of-anchor Q domain-containing protein [Patescibacteria group bacterium]